MKAPQDTLLHLATWFREFTANRRPAYVSINNKAEGSAPLSAFALAREIAGPI